MDDSHRAAVAEAFSRKATVYDAFGEGHDNLARMRGRVRGHILRYVKPGARMLEMNAGSGQDALYFASLGYRVHATDLAPGMLAQIREKIDRFDLAERMSVQECDFNSLDAVRGAPFDYVYSNMGGVNCAENVFRVARQVNQVLIEGGMVTWVVMPPICPWELAQALRGRWQTAFRRLNRGGVVANVEGVHFRTWYYPTRQVIEAFGSHYELVALEGLSVFTPPADHKDFSSKHPRIFTFLVALDDLFSHRAPFKNWGDFYVMTLRKRA